MISEDNGHNEEEDQVDFIKPSVASVVKNFEAKGFKLQFPTLLHNGDTSILAVPILSKSRGSSHDSDTSSAYSGSGTILSSVDAEEVDFSGLKETSVDDSDEEDLAEGIQNLTVRDTVRDCLEKNPCERTEEDVEVLVEFIQHLRAFANMTLFVRRELCRVMVLHVLEDAHIIVKYNGEELDDWNVIINGEVEVNLGHGEVQTLGLGDCFGISPTMEKVLQKGTMRTTVSDCQYVCVSQNDYYRIIHQGEENTKEYKEDGRVVLVTEHVRANDSKTKSQIVVKGTPEKLTRQLVEDTSADPNYVEDFLLTHRIFITNPLIVCEKFLEWFNDASVRDRVSEVINLWVKNHFSDFESDPLMMEFLETLQMKLEEANMLNEAESLSLTCASKARSRTVTLTRPSRDEVLNFSIFGGEERKSGIFIENVEKGSKAEEAGLKRGDEILEVNRHSFEHISLTKASEILKGSTHLSFTVKSNLLGLKNVRKMSECLLERGEGLSRKRSKRRKESVRQSSAPSVIECKTLGRPGRTTQSNLNLSTCGRKEKKGFMTLGHHGSRLMSSLLKMSLLGDGNQGSLDEPNSSSPPRSPQMISQKSHFRSNPQICIDYCDSPNPELREHVLKIYKSDQTFKYLIIQKNTTAHEVVLLALKEFGITDSHSNYSLTEVVIAEGGFIKQKKLADQCQDLAGRLGVASRYYLKNNQSTDPLVPDDLAAELKQESHVHLSQLNAAQVAEQLTLDDYGVFREIESVEYVDAIFSRSNRKSTPQLARFEELNNNEMFWVVTEICSEPNMSRRACVIRKLIEVALHCKQCKNFYSVFAIISGLNHSASRRLKETWEKVQAKHRRIFDDIQGLMDPSRNFSKYRNLINSESASCPIIPFFPIVNKDLTFIHDGNDTFVNGLVNFEKMRMVAKEVRSLRRMCSMDFEPSSHKTQSTDTVKRRKRSVATPPLKKLFEEEQMVRRVKAYLLHMKEKVIKDEAKLMQMSMELEIPHGSVSSVASPAGSVSSTGAETGSKMSFAGFMLASNIVPMTPVQMRRRQPASVLSLQTSSSTSNTCDNSKSSHSEAVRRVNTPQSRRKMLAFSEPVTVAQLEDQGILSRDLHPNSMSPSPSVSPVLIRRKEGQLRIHQERAHSDTPAACTAFGVNSDGPLGSPLRKDISGSDSCSDRGSRSSLSSSLKLGLALGMGLAFGSATDDPGYCTEPNSHLDICAEESLPKRQETSSLDTHSDANETSPRSPTKLTTLANGVPVLPLLPDVNKNPPPSPTRRITLANGVPVLPLLLPGAVFLPRGNPSDTRRNAYSSAVRSHGFRRKLSSRDASQENVVQCTNSVEDGEN